MELDQAIKTYLNTVYKQAVLFQHGPQLSEEQMRIQK